MEDAIPQTTIPTTPGIQTAPPNAAKQAANVDALKKMALKLTQNKVATTQPDVQALIKTITDM